MDELININLIHFIKDECRTTQNKTLSITNKLENILLNSLNNIQPLPSNNYINYNQQKGGDLNIIDKMADIEIKTDRSKKVFESIQPIYDKTKQFQKELDTYITQLKEIEAKSSDQTTIYNTEIYKQFVEKIRKYKTDLQTKRSRLHKRI